MSQCMADGASCRYKPFYVAAFTITGTCGLIWCLCGIRTANMGDKWNKCWEKCCASFLFSFLVTLRIFDMMSDWAFRYISLDSERFNEDNIYWDFLQGNLLESANSPGGASGQGYSKVSFMKHCSTAACVVGSLLLIPDLFSISIRFDAESKTDEPNKEAFKKVAIGICSIIWLEDIPQLAMTAIYLRAVYEPFFNPEAFLTISTGGSVDDDDDGLGEAALGEDSVFISFMDTVVDKDLLAVVSFVLSAISLLFNLYYAFKALSICFGKNKPRKMIMKATQKIKKAASRSFKRGGRERATFDDSTAHDPTMYTNPLASRWGQSALEDEAFDEYEASSVSAVSSSEPNPVARLPLTRAEIVAASASNSDTSSRVSLETEFRVSGCTGREMFYNGEYVPDGKVNGKTRYKHTHSPGRTIEWEKGSWRLAATDSGSDFKVASHLARPPTTRWVKGLATSSTIPMVQDLKTFTRTSSDT